MTRYWAFLGVGTALVYPTLLAAISDITSPTLSFRLQSGALLFLKEHATLVLPNAATENNQYCYYRSYHYNSSYFSTKEILRDC
jgi:hypothetical protein